MKKLILLYSLILSLSQSLIVNVNAQNTDLTPSGVYVPRLNTAQRDALTPTFGQMIYNNDVNCFNVYQANGWQNLCGFNIDITDAWKKKASFAGTSRVLGVGFSIGDKGYFGTGYGINDNSLWKDFWEYNSLTNTWTQKADFGGTTGFSGVGFSIGNMGYMASGAGSNFWQYNPNSNTWTQKAELSGGSKGYEGVGFSIGNKGYIGLGNMGSAFWEYNPSTDAWTRKADFPDGERYGSAGFSIQGKGYVGTGLNAGSITKKDFWEYNPSNDVWTRKADLPGSERYSPLSFSINGKGYLGLGGIIGSGGTNDFWEYNPQSNLWARKTDFVGTIQLSVGFSINDKGYAVSGFNSLTSDFYEYNPNSPIITQQGNDFNGASQLVKLDASGNIPTGVNITTPNFTNLPASGTGALTNNWVNYGGVFSTPAYYKDSRGQVYLKGLIKNGTIVPNVLLFTLPAGYRPSETLIFDATTYAASSYVVGRVDINSLGEVRFVSGGNTFFSLDGISFRAN
jgi:hypothetical protein